MDHHHHHPSSSTTTKEEEDLSHDDKRAKTDASSSSTINDHDVDTLPLPLPASHVHLCFLPDIAHDAIASYLTMKDMHSMMESSPWLLKAYGGRAKELRLASLVGSKQGDEAVIQLDLSQLALSLMGRRPGLTRIAIKVDNRTGMVMVEAMRKGYCDKMQLLKVESNFYELEANQALCDALADGLCPKINALMIPGIDNLMPLMGKALQSRMGKGCCGLKYLKVMDRAPSLSPLLSSGTCEALEELELVQLGSKAKEDLSEWLLRTTALHLRAFLSSGMDPDVAQALCSPGVAPRLQVLVLNTVDAASLPFLSHAIGGGAWPHLTRFMIGRGKRTIQETVPSLVEAIGVGARDLTTLQLGNDIGPEGGMAMARVLRDGRCPRLEELDLRSSNMGDGAVMELARALEGGAPCNTTLRRLVLARCGISRMGVRELMESMGRGALPHLECLMLDYNENIKDDGVVAFAGAMSGGSLRFLQQLYLSSVGMGPTGAKALFRAVREQKPCPHLKKLDLGCHKIGDDGVVHLAEAIEMGALQHLQELGIICVGMGEEGFKTLVKAIVAQHPNPGCPRLEELHVSGNKDIGDGGVVYLAEMVKVEGAMQHLREINLRSVGVSVRGLRALFQSLGESSACPALERVTGTDDCDLDDDDLDFLLQLRDDMNATRGRGRQIKDDL